MTAIVRVDPILEELERVFGDLWAPWKPVLVTGGIGMDLDVRETKDELVVKADLPGIGRDDVHIKTSPFMVNLELCLHHDLGHRGRHRKQVQPVPRGCWGMSLPGVRGACLKTLRSC